MSVFSCPHCGTLLELPEREPVELLKIPPILRTRAEAGFNLLGARTAKGWSQGRLAREAGLTQGAISNVETGRDRAGHKRALKIAEALGIDPSTIMSAEEEK